MKIASVMRDAVNLAFQYFWRKKRIKFNVRSTIVFFTWSWRTLKIRKNSKFKAKKIFIAIKTKTSKSTSFYFQKPTSNGFNVRMFFWMKNFMLFLCEFSSSENLTFLKSWTKKEENSFVSAVVLFAQNVI